MKRGFWRAVVVCSALLVAPVGALQQDVPIDLRPLLAAPQSEMRLVVVRYNADRSTLSGNYAGGNRAGGGRRGGGAGPAGGGAQPIDVPVSPDRIARLKRFDLDWQTALAKVDAAKLTATAKSDLDGLKSAIANDIVQLDADAVTLSRVAPAVPFRAALVQLIESRIRVEDVNSQKAAATLTQVTRRSRRAQDATGSRNRGRLGCRRAAPEQGSGGDGRAGDPDDPRWPHRVVRVLQRLRPHVHVVDRAAVQEDRRGPLRLRDVSAGQSRGRESDGRGSGAAAYRARARAEVQLGP